MVRRSTRVRTNTAKANQNAANASDGPSAQPNHRAADQPKGVLRPTNITSQPIPPQTNITSQAVEAVRLMPKEFDAVVGMRRLQLGLDAHASRQQELARLEVEDPIAHYYAQTPAERAPYQLQAAAVLFQMAGGDIAEPLAALNMMKAQREARETEEKKAKALLLGSLKVSWLLDLVADSLRCIRS